MGVFRFLNIIYFKLDNRLISIVFFCYPGFFSKHLRLYFFDFRLVHNKTTKKIIISYHNYDIIVIGDDKHGKYKTISRTKK